MPTARSGRAEAGSRRPAGDGGRDLEAFGNEALAYQGKDKADSSEEEEEDEQEAEEGTPSNATRRCTDISCLLFFVAVMFGFGIVAQYAYANGSVGKIQFKDGAGRVCGWHHETINAKYLFFCRNRTDFKLDTRHPICVSSCPTSWTDVHTACGGVMDYPTEPYMSMLCRPLLDLDGDPQSPNQQTLKFYKFQAGLADHIATDFVLVRICIQRWGVLLLCACGAVLASYLMICMLEQCGSILIRLGIAFLAMVPLVVGIFMSGLFAKLVGLIPNMDGVAVHLRPEDDHRHTLMTYGIILICVGLAFMSMAIMLRRSVDIAVDCIEMSCICVLQSPGLIVHPLAVVSVYILANSFLAYTGVLLISCGHFHLLHIQSAREAWFAFSNMERFLVLYLIWTFFLVHQTVFMISEFVVAYVTALWCFHGGLRGRGRVPRFTLWRGFWVCIRYHMGTCVYGAVAVGLIRPVSLTLGGVVSFMQLRGNPIGKVMRTFCCCCIDAFDDWVRPITKMATVDVVMNGNPFCVAASESLQIVRRQDDAVRILNGATWLIQVAGVFFMGGLGALAAMLYSENVKHDDPRVSTASLVAGGAVAMLVALPFVMIFDTVSDTILYCYEVQREREMAKKATEVRQSTWCMPCVLRDFLPWEIASGCADANPLLGDQEADAKSSKGKGRGRGPGGRGPDAGASRDRGREIGRGQGRRVPDGPGQRAGGKGAGKGTVRAGGRGAGVRQIY